MNKVESLKAELKKLQDSNLKAWEQYGSELSAGYMLKQEEKLRQQIKELEG